MLIKTENKMFLKKNKKKTSNSGSKNAVFTDSHASGGERLKRKAQEKIPNLHFLSLTTRGQRAF